jgi:hypothetical protein
MLSTLFLGIMHKLSETCLYFTERHDATGHIGLTPLQKCTAIMRQLAYGMDIDTIDEYLKLGKTTALECLEYYCAWIVECFGAKFLHRPTIDSHDCWHNSPVGWQGQFTQGTSNILQSSLSWFMINIKSRDTHESGEQWQHEGHEGFRQVRASVRIITLHPMFLVYYDSFGRDPLYPYVLHHMFLVYCKEGLSQL